MKKRAKAIPPDVMEIEDVNGHRVTVAVSYWRRWPSVRETFRPVAEQTGTSVSNEPPAGDEETEN